MSMMHRSVYPFLKEYSSFLFLSTNVIVVSITGINCTFKILSGTPFGTLHRRHPVEICTERKGGKREEEAKGDLSLNSTCRLMHYTPSSLMTDPPRIQENPYCIPKHTEIDPLTSADCICQKSTTQSCYENRLATL